MPRICTPDFSGARSGPGWICRIWASAGAFGQPVPLKVDRWRLHAGISTRGIQLDGAEALAYVIAGSGSARAGGETFPLARESVLWLSGCESLAVTAGREALDLLVARSTGPVPEGGFVPLRKVFTAPELPHLTSTRDTRDRLDLVTGDVPVGATQIRADRIAYHPGDTAAAHYHTDCYHVFCVLAGSGLLYSGERAYRLNEGDSALVGPGEVHWFENDTAGEFSFVEFWAPPPASTVWTVAGDRCTWAPAS